jgi:DNA adenine methylase
MLTLFDIPSELKPPLKWAGGKRWLVPILKEIWKPHQSKRLVEPFVGGMAIALGLSPEKAILNDTNPHLINFYQFLKKGLIANILYSNDSDTYYKHRERFNELIRTGNTNTKEAAELFYYLNRTGFNGLCRFNSEGYFNVPFGKYATINYQRDFTDYKRILKNWSITVGDFSSIDICSSDIIYADPPYDVEFTMYSAGGFDWNDQVRLAEWLVKQRVPVITSNQATERIIHLYKSLGFEIQILKAPRRISCNGDRTPADEMLATRGV